MSTNKPLPRASTVGWILSAMFAVTTVVGFLPNPLVGADAIFVTNGAHNMVHLLTAVGFAIFATRGDGPSILFMKGFGSVYFLVGVLGFITLGSASEGHLLGFIHINQLDNFLHVGLSMLILACGFLSENRAPALTA